MKDYLANEIELVREFLREDCTEDVAAVIKASDLCASYNAWISAQWAAGRRGRIRPLTPTAFGRAIAKAGVSRRILNGYTFVVGIRPSSVAPTAPRA